ncbi:hypothetical protein [Sphingomonas sp.]|uniref:hypothetical protein n=1 Tax=Sphingomonas sp. TaxID=28214 RepID=UPI0035C82AA6
MTPLRSVIRQHSWLAALLLCAALVLRVAVPAGFMPMQTNGGVRLMLCGGAAPLPPAVRAHGGHAAMHHAASAPDHGDHGTDAPKGCAFADLAVPLLGAADPVLLASAIAFLVAAAFFFRPFLRLQAAAHLRPPLRAPPALI